MPTTHTLRFALALMTAPIVAAVAQDATIVYRLGKDTVAVETFNRTPTRMVGETVIRSGGAIQRTQYDITIANGKATSALFRVRQANGTPIPNSPVEWRYTLGPDSAR